jgi:hypothetical protein
MSLRTLTFLNLKSLHTKAMAPIERITLFKIPNEADRDRVLEQYKVLAKSATKVCSTAPPIPHLSSTPPTIHSGLVE